MNFSHPFGFTVVGKQNFIYHPDIVKFVHIIQTHSTHTYNAIKEFLPLPSVQTLQYVFIWFRFQTHLILLRLHRSKQPHFPIGIQDRTYIAVIEKLNQLEYDGPVALSCDDTKLLASLWPYYDHDHAGYYLMEHIGEPFHLPDPDSFREVVDGHEMQKATKVSSINYIHRSEHQFIHFKTSFVYGVCRSLFPKSLLSLLLLLVFLIIWMLQTCLSIFGKFSWGFFSEMSRSHSMLPMAAT